MPQTEGTVATTPTIQPQSTFESMFKIAHERGVPLLVVRTADQFATAQVIRQQCTAFAVVQWDAARGLTPMMDSNGKPETKSKAALDGLKVNGAKVPQDNTVQFVDAMAAVQTMPRASVVLVHNAHRQVTSSEPFSTAQSVQAIANLRDLFKVDFRMLVLMGPEFATPSELTHDVVVLDHALPGPDTLATLVKQLHVDAKLPEPTDDKVAKAVEALRGLSEFSAEQQTAMSLVEGVGLDMDALWERKCVTIEESPGLGVYRGKETLDDLKGLSSIKARLRQHKNARTPTGVVVWIDEGSDVFANVEQDTSGVKTDQQKMLLVKMEQNNWRGMIFVGVPGSGKSAVARAFGNEVGVPEIEVDFGAMESRYVGDSEAKLRHAIDVIERVGDGKAFFILTCNSLKGIRPQFMRRFRRGVFFFDLPTKEERATIWAMYRAKYDIPANEPQPADEGWTGAEIRECCESAWDTRSTLLDAARFIIPVSQSRAKEIEEMRIEAHGRFLSASHPGAYTYEPDPMAKSKRAIALPAGIVTAIEQMKES